ncbi:MAG: aldo/keto reductase [Bdellovibrio sp.]
MTQTLLGTVQLGLAYGINNQRGLPTQERAFAILDEALRQGLDTLDTARDYGTALQVIGAFHANNTRQFKVLSKFKTHQLTEHNILREVESQLATLHVPRLECLSFHGIHDYKKAPSALRTQLAELKASGLVKKIGVSTYTTEESVTAIQDPLIDLIQMPFNLLDNHTLRQDVFKANITQKKSIHIRSVFLQGLFFMSSEDVSKKSTQLRQLSPYVEKLQQLATECQISIEELALTYAQSFPEIEGVVLGVDTPEQLQQLLKHRGKKLTLDIIAKINRITVPDKNLLLPTNW